MKDPNRFIEEKCEFCGLQPTIRWYDCCCEKQKQKYYEECDAIKKERDEFKANYELSFGVNQ